MGNSFRKTDPASNHGCCSEAIIGDDFVKVFIYFAEALYLLLE
jgi:hypothetical protein